MFSWRHFRFFSFVPAFSYLSVAVDAPLGGSGVAVTADAIVIVLRAYDVAAVAVVAAATIDDPGADTIGFLW